MKSKNITLSVDDELLRSSRQFARQRGLSLNRLVKDFLESIVGGGKDPDANKEFLKALNDAAGESNAKKKNNYRTWKREDAYQE